MDWQKHTCTYLNDSSDSSTFITRKGFRFHIDGALGAAYASFLQMAYENSLTDLKPPPVFDFQLNFVFSIVTSGHKWIGVPWPCGIYISKTEFQLRPPEMAHISYFDSPRPYTNWRTKCTFSSCSLVLHKYLLL